MAKQGLELRNFCFKFGDFSIPDCISSKDKSTLIHIDFPSLHSISMKSINSCK